MIKIRVEMNERAEDLLITHYDTVQKKEIFRKLLSRTFFRQHNLSIIETLKSAAACNANTHETLFVNVSDGQERVMWDSTQPFADYSEGYDGDIDDL